jgi:hypothetical protein
MLIGDGVASGGLVEMAWSFVVETFGKFFQSAWTEIIF